MYGAHARSYSTAARQRAQTGGVAGQRIAVPVKHTITYATDSNDESMKRPFLLGKDILAAFDSTCRGISSKITCLQPYGGEMFIVVTKTEDDCHRIFTDVPSIRFEGQEFVAEKNKTDPYDQKPNRVKVMIHDAPLTVPDSELLPILKKYGDVINDVLYWDRYPKPYDTICNGGRYCFMREINSEAGLPMSVFHKNNKFKLRHKGQERNHVKRVEIEKKEKNEKSTKSRKNEMNSQDIPSSPKPDDGFTLVNHGRPDRHSPRHQNIRILSPSETETESNQNRVNKLFREVMKSIRDHNVSKNRIHGVNGRAVENGNEPRKTKFQNWQPLIMTSPAKSATRKINDASSCSTARITPPRDTNSARFFRDREHENTGRVFQIQSKSYKGKRSREGTEPPMNRHNSPHLKIHNPFSPLSSYEDSEADNEEDGDLSSGYDESDDDDTTRGTGRQRKSRHRSPPITSDEERDDDVTLKPEILTVAGDDVTIRKNSDVTVTTENHAMTTPIDVASDTNNDVISFYGDDASTDKSADITSKIETPKTQQDTTTPNLPEPIHPENDQPPKPNLDRVNCEDAIEAVDHEIESTHVNESQNVNDIGQNQCHSADENVDVIASGGDVISNTSIPDPEAAIRISANKEDDTNEVEIHIDDHSSPRQPETSFEIAEVDSPSSDRNTSFVIHNMPSPEMSQDESRKLSIYLYTKTPTNPDLPSSSEPPNGMSLENDTTSPPGISTQVLLNSADYIYQYHQVMGIDTDVIQHHSRSVADDSIPPEKSGAINNDTETPEMKLTQDCETPKVKNSLDMNSEKETVKSNLHKLQRSEAPCTPLPSANPILTRRQFRNTSTSRPATPKGGCTDTISTPAAGSKRKPSSPEMIPDSSKRQDNKNTPPKPVNETEMK